MRKPNRVSCLTLLSFVLTSLGAGIALAHSSYDHRDPSNVRVDSFRFVRLDFAQRRVVGSDPNSGRLVYIPLASDAKIFAVSPHLEYLKPGDNVMVRSTGGGAGVVAASEVDVNVTAFDVLVVSLNPRGFAFKMLDYHTGLPLRGRTYTGGRAIANLAVILPRAAIDEEVQLRSLPAHVRDITVGDKAKLYGFQRPDSNFINVFRIEDRGLELRQETLP